MPPKTFLILHAEERPLLEAACAGSSGRGARLEARPTAMQRFRSLQRAAHQCGRRGRVNDDK
jgi:hypothetical protein